SHGEPHPCDTAHRGLSGRDLAPLGLAPGAQERRDQMGVRGRNQMKPLSELKVKIFADDADKAGMLEMYRNPLIQGFTTNPTVMRKAGVTDYPPCAFEILDAIPDRPLSFEVFSDDFAEMKRQALTIAGWGRHVYVKIPVTNCEPVSSLPLLRD